MMPSRPPKRIDRVSLRACVERAMAAYYQGPELARSRLCQLLPDAAAGNPPDLAELRALLREALESLRPPPQTPGDDPAWLPYRVITLHCIQSLSRGFVCEELAISQATFYRRRSQALDAMTDYLWRTLRARDAEDADRSSRARTALTKAVSVATIEHRDRLHLADIADSVQAIVMRMPGVSESSVKLDVMAVHEPVYGDPALLRQVLLNLVTDALRTGLEEPLSVRLWTGDEGIHGIVEPFPTRSIESGAGGFLVAQRLVKAAGGHLTVRDDSSSVRFLMPSALPPLILCLDDDVDALRLYYVYLAGEGYRVRGVTTGDELRVALEEELPSAVLLDVLMPREDGWAIIEGLQGDASTRRIPVVICSVLQQPELGLAMGAAAVLNKPITVADLRLTLEEVLAGHRRDGPAP